MPPRSTELPLLLTRVRRDLGLSQTELAARMGVAPNTVRWAEAGRDPRHSTLAAYLDAVIALCPESLFPVQPERPAPLARETWRYLRDVQGYEVRRLSRRLELNDRKGGRVITRFSGVRPLRGGAATVEDVVALMRSVCDGSSEMLKRIPACPRLTPGKRFDIGDGSVSHRYTFSAEPKRRGFSYQQDAPVPLIEADPLELGAPGAPREALGLVVDHPVAELLLSVRFLPGVSPARPSLLAYPASLQPGDDARDLVRQLHQDDWGLTWTPSTRRLVARVVRPLPGMRHVLTWERTSERPALKRKAKSTVSAPSLASRLAEARERTGLSGRALAARIGVSAMTVLESERGRDLRRSTLQRYLRALPGLTAWDLFPGAVPRTAMSRDALWEYYRRVFGCVAAEETKTVTLSSEGDSTIVIRTRELRVERPSGPNFSIRLGFGRPVLQDSSAQLRIVKLANDEAEAGCRIVAVPGRGGTTQHQLTVPIDGTWDALGYRRELQHSGIYAMTSRRAARRTGRSGPYVEGASFAALIPVRRLALVIRFPEGFWPDEIEGHVWPATQAPSPDAEGLAAQLHPTGLELDKDRRRNRLRLTVHRPLIGVKYGIGWQLR